MKNLLLRKGFVLTLIFLCLGISIIPSPDSMELKGAIITFLKGNTLYVGGNGSNNYTTIQSAINDASNGDTVFVYDDSSPYYENVVIDKSIRLIGEDKDSTVIDAQKEGIPVLIIADNCLVSGFTIINMEDWIGNDWDYAVIQVDGGNNVVIMDNIIYAGDGQELSSWYSAIDLFESTNCVISNNYLSHIKIDQTYGVAVRNSSNNIISGNDISIFNVGIGNSWFEDSNNNIISENRIHHNIGGILLLYNCYNEMLNNTIEYNSYIGLDIVYSHHNTVSGNVISNNGDNDSEFSCGLSLTGEECSDNIVSDNIISNNIPTGIYIVYAYDNVITRNNFIDNYGEGTPERWWGNAYFCNPLNKWRFFNLNSWKSNYWSDLGTANIKFIKGHLDFILFNIPWFAFDWNPAKKPYNYITFKFLER